MKTYDISRLPSVINIGYDGENNWRPQSFDCTSLLAKHPEGVITLWLLPKGETQAFPVALERDGNKVIWTPLDEEMTALNGAIQIVCVDGTDVGKSAVVLWRVDESIVPGAEHPAAVPSWATQVIEQYQNAIEHYPTIIDGTWHVWDVDNETWEDTGVSAQGVDGEDGHSPYIALNGHWMVYNDAQGEWIDTGVSASVDEAVIANAVAAYLDEHPITVTETDPTVPEWAKNPTKPTYTASEVGALPSSYTPPVESVNGKTGAVVLGASDVGALPSDTVIPPAVTEQDVAGWGFTKNTGTYSKPSAGIPKTDLSQAVQGELDSIVPFEIPVSQSGDSYTTTASAAGIIAHVGNLVLVDPSGVRYKETSYLADGNSAYALFTFGDPSGGDLIAYGGYVVSVESGTVNISLLMKVSGVVPEVSSTDNGKFLRVADGAWTAEAGDEYSAFPSDTASGAIASFPDGADDAPVKSLVAQIAPVQSGSGDPSPTNIRPISGWTSATITRTGADNQSDTYTITFPAEAGTVYGGTLDVANGVLTVDSAIVDMGTLYWMYYPNQQRMVAQVNSAKPAMANVGLDGACSVYKVVNTAYRLAPDKSIVISNNFISQNYAAMVVFDSAYTDAATFKTAVSGQTLVFPIKNPVTYQLDPVTVTTLLGVNNIWADTGDVAVDYRADTGLYIQKLTGSTEEDMIADAPIASGKYFLVGNTLYLSTAEIAAGATLTPGTNCVKTNLAEALNALNKTETIPSAESNSFGGGS